MSRLPLRTTAMFSMLLMGGLPTIVFADDFDGDGVEDTLDVCCNTPPGVPVDAEGRPVGDIDQDCDVDLADFLLFQDSFTGPMECTPEVCDGMDNDCNCLVDDMGILSCGIGACYREVEVCVDGVLQDCVPGDPVPEACDNALDDDCDGVTDCEDADDCPVGTPCDDPGLHLACTESETCDCADFWADCDADPANGCEIDLESDLAHCGECGHACVLAHAVPTCVGGECEIVACDSGWDDCDGDAETGCETDLSSDPDHCGGCGQPCVFAHGTAACVAAACVLLECDPGWGDCDDDSSNGCETDLMSDLDHCGECGVINVRTRTAPSPVWPASAYSHVTQAGTTATATRTRGAKHQLTLIPKIAVNAVTSACCRTRQANAWGAFAESSAVRTDGPIAMTAMRRGAKPPSTRKPRRAAIFTMSDHCAATTDVKRWAQSSMSANGPTKFASTNATTPHSRTLSNFAAQLDSPPGLDYDLYLYSPCGDQRHYSSLGAGQIDTVEFSWSDVYFPDEDDSRYVYVEVRFYSGNRCEDWELTFYGDCDLGD